MDDYYRDQSDTACICIQNKILSLSLPVAGNTAGTVHTDTQTHRHTHTCDTITVYTKMHNEKKHINIFISLTWKTNKQRHYNMRVNVPSDWQNLTYKLYLTPTYCTRTLMHKHNTQTQKHTHTHTLNQPHSKQTQPPERQEVLPRSCEIKTSFPWH